MRILHVVQPPRGGTPALVELLVRAQVAENEVGVVCRPRLAARLAGSGASIWALPMHRAVRPLNDAAHLVRLVRIIRRFGPDVVHAHSSKAGALARPAALVTRVPVVFSPHNFAFRAHEGGRLRRTLWLAVERLLAPLTSHLHVAYDAEREDALRHRLVDSHRVTVVPNGIDAGPLLEVERRPAAPLTVGTYARLWPQKRIDLLLHAAAGVAERGLEFRIEIIGEGPLRAELQRLADRLGIAGRTSFVEDPGSAAAAMSRLDVFVLSSSQEAYPLTVMEAMAAGKAVVATSVGALPEMIDPNRTGVLVPPGDAYALERALGMLIEDPQLIARLAAGARRHAKDSFGIAEMAARLDPVYRAAAKCSRTSDGASGRS